MDTSTLKSSRCLARRCCRILEWLRKQPNGATKAVICCFIPIGNKPVTEAIEALLESGNIEHCKVMANHGHLYDGYRMTSKTPRHWTSQ